MNARCLKERILGDRAAGRFSILGMGDTMKAQLRDKKAKPNFERKYHRNEETGTEWWTWNDETRE